MKKMKMEKMCSFYCKKNWPHEYILDELQEMFIKVLDYTPHLLDSVKCVKDHCKKYETVDEE